MLTRLSPLVLIPAASSCVVVSEGHFGATLHTVGYDTTHADATAPGLGLDGAVDVEGVGVDVALMGHGADFLLGYENREYDDVEADEFWAGLRQTWDQGRFSPYILGKVRYSDGLELPGGDSESFVGWGLGIGVLIWATEHVYLDLNLVHEDLFQDADTPTGDIDLDGWVGTAGIGFAF